MKKSSCLTMIGFAMFLAVSANASTATFNFTTEPSSSSSSYANSLTFSSTSGTPLTVTITAWSLTSTASGTDFATAALDNYNGANLGLGVCSANDPSGASCSSPYHQIDNSNTSGVPSVNGPDEFVQFQFSSPVILNGGSVAVTNYAPIYNNQTDEDLTYYTASTSLTTSTPLSALGTGLTDTASLGSGIQAVESLSGNTAITYLIIGASVPDAKAGAIVDAFKLNSLTVTTPEPSTFGLIGLALTGLGIFGRKRKTNRG